tara:strand:- start:147 stop:398 length:252 start_codon:yes stop_codon:yes gene_type:complete
MNKRVVCIDDNKLPPGADIKEGSEYMVRKIFNNNFDQRVYIISGVRNLGRTKYGLPWEGYRAERFEDMSPIENIQIEQSFAMN